MVSRLSAPGPEEKRFAAYMEDLAIAAGHADHRGSLKNCCTGLFLLGERKSLGSMAARLAPDDVRSMHQSFHHMWLTQRGTRKRCLERVRQRVVPAMRRSGPVVAWIIDDTGLPKHGKIPAASNLDVR